MASRSNPLRFDSDRRLRWALALVATWAGGCASQRVQRPPAPVPEPVGDVRRAEEQVERTAVVPQVPREVAPRRVTAVSTSWPVAAAGSEARPISALARSESGSGSSRELVYALSVPFPANAVVLTATARSILDQLAARLNLGDSLFYLEIQGHADSSGTDTRNMALALQRAQAVRDYLLVASGLPAARIAVVSLGAGQPVGDNATPEGRAANRRVVVLALR